MTFQKKEKETEKKEKYNILFGLGYSYDKKQANTSYVWDVLSLQKLLFDKKKMFVFLVLIQLPFIIFKEINRNNNKILIALFSSIIGVFVYNYYRLRYNTNENTNIAYSVENCALFYSNLSDTYPYKIFTEKKDEKILDKIEYNTDLIFIGMPYYNVHFIDGLVIDTLIDEHDFIDKKINKKEKNRIKRNLILSFDKIFSGHSFYHSNFNTSNIDTFPLDFLEKADAYEKDLKASFKDEQEFIEFGVKYYKPFMKYLNLDTIPKDAKTRKDIKEYIAWLNSIKRYLKIREEIWKKKTLQMECQINKLEYEIIKNKERSIRKKKEQELRNLYEKKALREKRGLFILDFIIKKPKLTEKIRYEAKKLKKQLNDNHCTDMELKIIKEAGYKQLYEFLNKYVAKILEKQEHLPGHVKRKIRFFAKAAVQTLYYPFEYGSKKVLRGIQVPRYYVDRIRYTLKERKIVTHKSIENLEHAQLRKIKVFFEKIYKYVSIVFNWVYFSFCLIPHSIKKHWNLRLNGKNSLDNSLCIESKRNFYEKIYQIQHVANKNFIHLPLKKLIAKPFELNQSKKYLFLPKTFLEEDKEGEVDLLITVGGIEHNFLMHIIYNTTQFAGIDESINYQNIFKFTSDQYTPNLIKEWKANLIKYLDKGSINGSTVDLEPLGIIAFIKRKKINGGSYLFPDTVHVFGLTALYTKLITLYFFSNTNNIMGDILSKTEKRVIKEQNVKYEREGDVYLIYFENAQSQQNKDLDSMKRRFDEIQFSIERGRISNFFKEFPLKILYLREK